MKKILVTIAGLLLLVSCEDKGEYLSTGDNSVDSTQETTTNIEEELKPVVLGEKLENPFSVENMQLALNSLLEKPNELESAGVSKRNVEVLEITPTDWYICFKVDSTQFNTLISDTTLSLTPPQREFLLRPQSPEYQISRSFLKSSFVPSLQSIFSKSFVSYPCLELSKIGQR